MIQYLITLLDDTSTSYCHYGNLKTERRLIGLDDLRKGIFFAMKENLMIQFVYPNYPLPKEYVDVIDTIDHSDIVSSEYEDEELLLIAGVALLLFGGKKLPELMRGMGQGVKNFKEGLNSPAEQKEEETEDGNTEVKNSEKEGRNDKVTGTTAEQK